MKKRISMLSLLTVVSCSKYSGKDTELDKRCPTGDLSNTDLSDRDLSDCDFSNMNMNQVRIVNSDLSRTRFVRTNLRQATLSNNIIDETVFTEAALHGAQIDSGNWFKANVERAVLDDSSWTNVVLEGVNFQKATGSHVTFNGATIYRSHFGETILNFSDFKGGAIQYSYFSHTKDQAGFTNVNFDGPLFFRNSFQSANLANNRFLNIPRFEGTDFQAAKISGTEWRKVNGGQLNFSKAQISNTLVDESNLSGGLGSPLFESKHPAEAFPFPLPEIGDAGLLFRLTEMNNVSFDRSVLKGALFHQVNGLLNFANTALDGAVFKQSQIPNSHFSGSSGNLNSTEFLSSDLAGAQFHEIQIINTIFHDTGLQNVRFSSVTSEGMVMENSRLLGFDISKSKIYGARFVNIKNFEGLIYGSTLTATTFDSVVAAALNISFSNLTDNTFKNSSFGFHAISTSTFTSAIGNDFSLNSIKPWETNPFEIVANGASFLNAVLSGGLGDYFFEWLIKSSTGDCTSRRLDYNPIVITTPSVLKYTGNQSYGFNTADVTTGMIKNFDGLTMSPSVCPGKTYRCITNNGNLNCGAIQ